MDSCPAAPAAVTRPARLPWPLALLVIGGLSAALWLGIARLAGMLVRLMTS